MANKILVSLVSEQTIPNVELIKEFQNEIDRYIFIYSAQMKNQLRWIVNASGISENNYDKLMVNAFDTTDIENKIKHYDFGDDDIILNITGGTKLMLIIINEIFRELGSTIYYLTGHNKSYVKVYPNRGERNLRLKSKLTLNEYLSSYGFSYSETKPYNSFETAENIFNFYISKQTDELVDIFEPIRLRRRKKMEVTDKLLTGFLKNVKYSYNNILKDKDTKYLSGDWFEEYVYYWVKNGLNLSDDEIATGINIKKEGTPNEIDVIFIYNHRLYIIECKTSIVDLRKIKKIRSNKEVEEEKEIKLLPEIIYKSDALRNKFGLFADTSIFTLEEIKKENGTPADGYKTHFDRAELSRIRIVSKRDITSGKSIKEILNIK
jgi:hypothetical protein